MKSNSNTIYVVEALRNGDREKHSYVVGVWDSLEEAKVAADCEADYRGGKYVCVVNQCALNERMDTDFSATILYQSA